MAPSCFGEILIFKAYLNNTTGLHVAFKCQPIISCVNLAGIHRAVAICQDVFYSLGIW